MRVLGIDPGLATTGWGVVDEDKSKLSMVDYGVIKTPAKLPHEERLVFIHQSLLDLIKKLREDFNLSILIISHNIAHIFELVDRIVVLRNGEIVGERMKDETNANEIVSMITGVAG